MTAATVDVDWRLHAACRRVHFDLFFNHQTAAEALHICRQHCPVLAECGAEARARPPYECVMGGVVWRADGGKPPRPVRQNRTVARRCELCEPDPDPVREAHLRHRTGEASGC